MRQGRLTRKEEEQRKSENSLANWSKVIIKAAPGTDEVKLKPCKLCGGPAKRKEAEYSKTEAEESGECETKGTEKHWYAVYCMKCRIGQQVEFYTSREASDAAWNTKA